MSKSTRCAAAAASIARQGFDGATVVLRHGAFVVADHDGRTDGTANEQRFLDREQHVIGFVAHVRHVEATGVAQRFRDSDHFVSGRHHVWWIVEAGGEAGCALRQRLRQAALHVCSFLVGGGALGVAVHRLDAQRHVADQRDRR